jgi:hypothetical protein
MAHISDWKIVRRAYGKYEHVATVRGTWDQAVNVAMSARVINGYDGEYFERAYGEPLDGRVATDSVFYSK